MMGSRTIAWRWMGMFALAAAACSAAPESNAVAGEASGKSEAATPSPKNCDFPKLDFRAASELTDKEKASFTANLRTAFDRACGEGLFVERPLVDPRSYDRSLLYVMNAPEADVTSIYFGPSAAPPAMLLESPFRSPAQIPTVEELHEAIYCEMRGATPEEQERDGRCLVD